MYTLAEGKIQKKVVYTHVPLNIEGRRQVKEKHDLKEGGAHWFQSYF